MRINEPVTNNEVHMKDGEILVSRTNLKGIITDCNENFIRISGFSRKELIGKNHNMVRHPDMPPEAFQDLWDTVKEGKPWRGIVKNRCNNGDFYWVVANVTPVTENGRVTEYMSMRTKPTRAQIAEAETLYTQINAGKMPKASLLSRFNFLSKMKIWHKLSIAVVLLTMVALIATINLVGLSEDQINFSAKEVIGVKYIDQVVPVIKNMPMHRGMTNAYLNGDESFKPRILSKRNEVDNALTELKKVDAEFSQQLSSSEKLNKIVADWEALKNQAFDLSAKESFARHTAIIEEIVALVAHVGDQSNLILDPDLDSYYLMDLIVLKVPTAIDKLGQIRGLGSGIIARGSMTREQEIKLTELDVYAEILRTGSIASLDASFNANEEVKKALLANSTSLREKLSNFNDKVQLLRSKKYSALDSKAFFNDGSDAIKLFLELHEAASPMLLALLEKRIEGFRNEEIALIVQVVIALVIALLAAVFITRDITSSVRQVIREFRELSEGDYQRDIPFSRQDELGDLLKGLKSTQIKLGCDVNDAREAANAMSRIKVALDNVSGNVMMADNQGEIIYLNKAVIDMMRNAQDDIRKDLPNFNVDALQGANIDVFHKNPDHQRRMLESMTSAHDATILIGGRTFSLTANPVVNDEGERLGTAVEWIDRTLEVAIEKEVENIVGAAQNGNLSQQIDLAGKTGFFKVLSEGINKLISTVGSTFNDVDRVMAAMSSGDLTQKITEDYAGTYGEVKDNINTTIDKLEEVVGKIRESSEFIRNSSEEISAGNNNLSQRAEEQASTLEETASSMEELTSTVKNNADNAQQANQLADSARSMAEKGGNVVKEAVLAMDEITSSSNKIAEIISVIDEIAFQTNLLALNASVEAARAGEQGRGFAVVATEVRNLAQRSATAAKEIKDLISDSVEKVNAGGKLVNESGETLNEIVDGVKKVGDIISEIAASSQEQAAGIEQVNKAVVQMDEITQQNAALAEEASASSEASLHRATDMNNLVGFFKVTGSFSSADYERSVVSQSVPETKAKTEFVQQTSIQSQVSGGPGASVDDDDWEEF